MKKGEMLGLMIVMATMGHRSQFDKQGEPYILHPLAVMQNLDQDADEELRCIAIGHDLFEDTMYTAEILRDKGISERVINGISCLTKTKSLSAEDYLDRILMNTDAIKVKMADIEHNTDIRRLKGVTDRDFARSIKYMNMYVTLKRALTE